MINIGSLMSARINPKQSQEAEIRQKKTLNLKEELIDYAHDNLAEFDLETIMSHLNFATLPKSNKLEQIFSKFPTFGDLFVTRETDVVRKDEVLTNSNGFKVEVQFRPVMDPLRLEMHFFDLWKKEDGDEAAIKTRMSTVYDPRTRQKGNHEYIANTEVESAVKVAKIGDPQVYTVPAGCLPINSEGFAYFIKKKMFARHKVSHTFLDEEIMFPPVPGKRVDRLIWSDDIAEKLNGVGNRITNELDREALLEIKVITEKIGRLTSLKKGTDAGTKAAIVSEINLLSSRKQTWDQIYDFRQTKTNVFVNATMNSLFSALLGDKNSVNRIYKAANFNYTNLFKDLQKEIGDKSHLESVKAELKALRKKDIKTEEDVRNLETLEAQYKELTSALTDETVLLNLLDALSGKKIEVENKVVDLSEEIKENVAICRTVACCARYDYIGEEILLSPFPPTSYYARKQGQNPKIVAATSVFLEAIRRCFDTFEMLTKILVDAKGAIEARNLKLAISELSKFNTKLQSPEVRNMNFQLFCKLPLKSIMLARTNNIDASNFISFYLTFININNVRGTIVRGSGQGSRKMMLKKKEKFSDLYNKFIRI